MQEVVHLIQDNVNRLFTNRVTIRRRLAFADYVDARKRKWFAEGGNLKICFAGEPSIDGGGPRREFFTDVLQHIKSTLFDANGYPLFSTRALANEDFMANNWLELVHDANFKDEINKLVKCESDEELRTLLCSDDMMNILQSIGYRGVPSKEKLALRDNIIRSIVIAGIGHMLAMMDQLKTGLTLFGVLQQIQHHREIMASMLTLDGVANFCLTADIFLENMTVEFSPQGSNKKQLEINVHKFFCDYIQELNTRDTSTSLKTLYRFITGSHSVTPLGAEKHITVKFKHGCPENCKCHPTAATCDPSICFPIHFDNTMPYWSIRDLVLYELENKVLQCTYDIILLSKEYFFANFLSTAYYLHITHQIIKNICSIIIVFCKL
ncbi:uncharacterized protein LOC124438863 [Xenia sp. Carnegie-2017]|uniref:uncharacterized protein LOC124438863 n=1 Tax=Xenia sp. Carnegie-2017 TaxID=2897299 RepID=UPI001F04BAFB|nr:uncharacterized protein LOC124438863 [Xenia sp. Carnegie-2017]